MTQHPKLLRLSDAISYGIIVVGFAVAIWSLVISEPPTNPMTVYALRIFLSLAAGLSANIIAGNLEIKWLKENSEIRSTGAIAFAVVTFYSAPNLAPSLDPVNVQRDPPSILNAKVWSVNNLIRPEVFPQTQKSTWVFKTIELMGMHHESMQHVIDGRRAIGDLTKALAGQVSDQQKLEVIDRALQQGTADEEDGKTIYAIAETPRFDVAHRAFDAMIRTLPSLEKGSPDKRHDILPFLISDKGHLKSFTPLTRKHDDVTQELFIDVPESQPGDYLFFIIKFRFKQATPTTILPLELITT
ncbi:hypothetical protein Enr13x_18470 [Stieleria neptunia]|uniref:Uncharacterized protein n=1 Tax=Stieleria neptunia TaxID=2527979 RepID=A0A518HMC1_9BACT|nr:hypothetical protein [Stieleria neptunia]QDV42004.1 hypothetical protein Enr13x_18470 [Stieleria neptunia]